MSVCGSTETTTGEPCQNGPNCPYHRGPGRPTKYRPRYCEKVVELGRQGDGVAEIADELGVSKQTLHNWQGQHPAFLDAMTRARDAAEAWWSRQGKEGIWSREFNASAYRLQVMNRFGWGEKQEVEHSGGTHDTVTHDIPRKNRIAALRALAGRASGAGGNGTGDAR